MRKIVSVLMCGVLCLSTLIPRSADANRVYSLNEKIIGKADVLLLSERLLKSAVQGEKSRFRSQIDDELLGSVADTLNEAGLATGLTQLKLKSLIENTKGTAKYHAYARILNHYAGALSLHVSAALLARAVLDKGLSPQVARPAYKLLTESIFYKLGVHEFLAPGVWAASFLDYALTAFMDNTFTTYEKYWFDVFSYAFTFIDEYKVPISVWAEYTIDITYMKMEYEKNGRHSDKFAPWNYPKFVALSDRFWSEADVFSAHYQQAYPHLKKWPLNKSLLAEARFKESFRRKFFIGHVSGRLQNHLNGRMLKEARKQLEEIENLVGKASQEIYREMKSSEGAPKPKPNPPKDTTPGSGEGDYLVARLDGIGSRGEDVYITLQTSSRWFKARSMSLREAEDNLKICVRKSLPATAQLQIVPLFQTQSPNIERAVARFLEGYPMKKGGWKYSPDASCMNLTGISLTDKINQVQGPIYRQLLEKW